MLSKINRNLRVFIIIAGALLVLLKITEDKSKLEQSRSSKSGFHAEEFDDIW